MCPDGSLACPSCGIQSIWPQHSLTTHVLAEKMRCQHWRARAFLEEVSFLKEKTLSPTPLMILMTPNVWRFFPHQPNPQFSGHEPAVLQFSSVLIHVELVQTHRLRAQSHKTTPLGATHKTCVTTRAANPPALSQGVPISPSSVQ